MSDTKIKIAVCWHSIGMYSCLFEQFYESFNKNFCNECEKTFFIFTDKPEITIGKTNCLTYVISNSCLNIDFNLYRKFKYLLMAEDKYLNYDYVIFCNGNLNCQYEVSLDELFNSKKYFCCQHPMMATGYFQAAMFGAASNEFLKMANQIESQRMFDVVNGLQDKATWHDETYFNKYINTINDKNILNGVKYICPKNKTHFTRYAQTAKIVTLDKQEIFKANFNQTKSIAHKDLYRLT